MFLKHPAMAKRWAAETPKGAKLPEHVKAKRQDAASRARAARGRY